MNDSNYRILWKGQITGPFDREQVEGMLSKNEIGVWAEISEGNSDWKPISEWRERKPAFKAASKVKHDRPPMPSSAQIDAGSEPAAGQGTPDLPPLPHEPAYQSTEADSNPSDFHYDGGHRERAPKDEGFFHWAFMPLRKYAVFSGRARRKEFWLFFLLFWLLQIAAGAAIGVMGYSLEYSDQVVIEYAEMAGAVIYLLLFLPFVAVIIRRLHDTNRSGWWWLLMLTGIGSLILLLFAVQEGTEGENEYGADPQLA